MTSLESTMKAVVIAVSLLVLASLARGRLNFRPGSTEELHRITAGIDTYLVPGGQVNVSAGLYIGYLKPNPDDETLTVRMYLRQSWRDEQLAHGLDESLTFNGDASDLIWTPDTFYRNSLRMDRFSDNPDLSLARISPEGVLWYVQSMVIAVPCNGLNRAFKVPGTNHVQCIVMLESYKYTTDSVILQFLTHSVDIDPQAPLGGNVRLNGTHYDDCTTTYTAGTFPCIKWLFDFEVSV